MEKLQLSIAMCTYNGGLYIREQLDSISRQTRQPDELIICDDGSTDDTISICKAYSHRVSFPVTIHRNEETLGAARNFEQAIRRCHGAIIALADQDDVWQSEKLARLEATLGANPTVDVVFTDAEIVDANLRPLGYRLWQYIKFTGRDRKRLRNKQALDVLLKRNVVSGATMAFRAKLREAVLPIPHGWLHDEWIALVTSTFSRLMGIPEPLIRYRQHQDNWIGAGKKGLFARLVLVREEGRQPAVAEIQRLETAREYISNCRRISRRAEVLEQLDNKILHLQARISLSERKWSRWPIILKELATGRYHRYSRGFSSFARDLLYP